jgi:hypothetical protein
MFRLYHQTENTVLYCIYSRKARWISFLFPPKQHPHDVRLGQSFKLFIHFPVQSSRTCGAAQPLQHTNRVIQHAGAILRTLLSRSLRAQNVNNAVSDSPRFPRDVVLILMWLCIILIVWRGLRAESSWTTLYIYIYIYIYVATRSHQTLTAVTASSATELHYMNRKVLRNNYSEMSKKL